MALYEWALSNDPGLTSPKHWAQHFITHMAGIWPKDQLGDPAVPGETIGFSATAIYELLIAWKTKYHRDLRRPREMACKLILKTQLYAPSAAVRIMDYFKPAQNVLVNQGVLMPQSKAEPAAPRHFISHATQTTERGRTWADVAKATPQPRPPVGRTPIDEASPPSASPATPATLPAGLLRGGAGSGRGGGLQPGFKMAMCELISDCSVPIRDVPKVFAVVWTAIFRQPPPADALFGHSHISEWMTDLGAAGLQADIAAFWQCRGGGGTRVSAAAGGGFRAASVARVPHPELVPGGPRVSGDVGGVPRSEVPGVGGVLGRLCVQAPVHLCVRHTIVKPRDDFEHTPPVPRTQVGVSFSVRFLKCSNRILSA